ncbi:hypothetical protein SH591_10375 [Sphingomonas sp. LY54]|uniref:hypothetical protein n=1 Tax=Sphingomonadales TaxID=204457 RepID=UPI002ADED72A|nr:MULTISPECIES: hypothetical protein [Sphingomonadales]MEA1014421.1 hypothetical protein [Sphingosinicella sp. LY1275]WRP27525.1 hypothetical protein SH591_10375 [Sphingomonas sp. LY54]
MLLKTALLAAAAALPLAGAGAQVAVDVNAGVNANLPVQSTVDAATDAVRDAANTAADAANQSVGATAKAEAGDAKLVAVTQADIKAGDTVRDTAGGVVGKIESVDASGAVIATGKSRVQIPVTSFGKNQQGLVIAMTRAELDAAASAKTPS